MSSAGSPNEIAIGAEYSSFPDRRFGIQPLAEECNVQCGRSVDRLHLCGRIANCHSAVGDIARAPPLETSNFKIAHP